MTGLAGKTTTERWSRASGGVERRAAAREAVLLPAIIVLEDGRRIPCVIVDRSAGGLRVTLPTGDETPKTFCVVDLVTGVGREMALAWRQADNAGLRTLKTHALDNPKDEVGERLRQVWIAALG
jgi:hypothetical protein